MLEVVVIGAGNVAENLAMEISEAPGLRLVQQWSRKTHTPTELARADLYILAVSDGAVVRVAAKLPFPAGSVVAHTAGSVPMSALHEKIAHRAVIYPLQSFTRGRRMADFRSTPFFVEGSTPHALAVICEVAQALSDSVVEMSSEARAKLHLAGTFANNFSNAMLSLAEMLAVDAGVSFEVLKPLIAETFAKAADVSSPRSAQTGPAARGDEATQAAHLKLLRETHPDDLPELYETISRIIWKISKKN